MRQVRGLSLETMCQIGHWSSALNALEERDHFRLQIKNDAFVKNVDPMLFCA